jgi:hypothetical protein
VIPSEEDVADLIRQVRRLKGQGFRGSLTIHFDSGSIIRDVEILQKVELGQAANRPLKKEIEKETR